MDSIKCKTSNFSWIFVFKFQESKNLLVCFLNEEASDEEDDEVDNDDLESDDFGDVNGSVAINYNSTINILWS